MTVPREAVPAHGALAHPPRRVSLAPRMVEGEAMSPRHAGLLALVAALALIFSTGAAMAVTSRGDAKPNRITGTANADRLYGGGGRDSLRGLGGRDRLDGGQAPG